MTRFAPRLMVLFLCGTALAGCADSSNLASTAAGKASAQQAKADAAAPTDMDSALRQAQLLRQAGHYDEAIHTLSQLMLVASDDARVVGEYGKTQAEMGRAQDATQFLTRAIELQGKDWTLYSALGVAYDQLGDQNSARMAYEHALALKPSEPSVLNNYALSRMMANDPVGARQLAERARLAGGANDSKIARNIVLVDQLAPVTAQNEPAPVTKPAPVTTRQATAAPAPLAVAPAPLAVNAPRPVQPDASPVQKTATVVTQPLPVDPVVAKPKPLSTPKAVAKADKPVVVATPVTVAVKTDKPVPAPVVAAAKAAAVAAPVVTVAKADKPVVVAPPVAVAAKADKPVVAAATIATPTITVAKTDKPVVVATPVVAAAKTDKPVADAKPLAATGKPTPLTAPVVTVAKADKPVVVAQPIAAPVMTAKATLDIKPAVADAKTAGAPAVTLATIANPVATLPVFTIADTKADKPVVAAAKTDKPASAPAPTAKGPIKAADARSKNDVPALRMASGEY